MEDTILVAVDDSDTAAVALEHAVELGAALGAAIHAITVVEVRGSRLSFGVEEVDEINRAAEGLLEEAREAHADRAVDLQIEVRRGQPAETILEYAEEIGADRIVVGQKGTSGLSGALIGSTADRLARLASVPVTIVPGRPEEAS